MAFAGGLGIEADLAQVPSREIDRDDYLLFSESQSRFVVTIDPLKQQSFEDIMKENTCRHIGMVIADSLLRIKGIGGNTIIEEDINHLKAAWQAPLNF
jgi:phosphoribosylformylglycinamidine synthase